MASQLAELAGSLYLCQVGELEQLCSARDYDATRDRLRAAFEVVSPAPDLLERALDLQRDLAHHRGMWHRTPIPDLLIACTAMYHGLGVVHVDRGFERIAEVRPLIVRRLG